MYLWWQEQYFSILILFSIFISFWSLLICFSHYWFHPWSLWGEKIWDLQAICRQPFRPKLLLQYLLWGASEVPGPGFYQLWGGPHLDHWAEISNGWYQWRRQFGPEATHPWSISFIQSLSDNMINYNTLTHLAFDWLFHLKVINTLWAEELDQWQSNITHMNRLDP